MTTVPYLALSDGTTTIVFADGSTTTPGDYSYNVNGWAPNIAQMIGDEISVTGLYSDVIEVIDINIKGSSASALYANVAALGRLLDQAQRWNLGDRTVNPVRIRYIPGGSAKTISNYYEALLLDTDQPMLQLPDDWSKGSAQLALLSAKLRLRRRGLWLNETDALTATTQPSGTLMTVTYGTNHPQLSPVRIDMPLGSTAAGSYSLGMPAQVLITAPSADIEIQEAETYSDPGDGGSFSPAAGELARGSSVWRMVAGAAGLVVGPVYSAGSLIPLLRTEGQYAVFAVCRATVDNWRIKGVYYHVDDLLTGVSMPEQSLLLGYQVVSLGIISAAPDHGVAVFAVELNAPSASTFTIDYFVFVKLGEACSILSINRLYSDSNGYAASTAIRESVIPDLTTRRSPFVGLTNNASTLNFSIGAAGDRVPYQSGADMASLWLACSGNSYRIDTHAITSSAATGTLLSTAATFTRRRGYLVPE
jgi:hypothetical protein